MSDKWGVTHALVLEAQGVSEDTLLELVFNQVDPGDGTEESRLGSKYPRCYFASLGFVLFF